MVEEDDEESVYLKNAETYVCKYFVTLNYHTANNFPIQIFATMKVYMWSIVWSQLWPPHDHHKIAICQVKLLCAKYCKQKI